MQREHKNFNPAKVQPRDIFSRVRIVSGFLGYASLVRAPFAVSAKRDERISLVQPTFRFIIWISRMVACLKGKGEKYPPYWFTTTRDSANFHRDYRNAILLGNCGGVCVVEEVVPLRREINVKRVSFSNLFEQYLRRHFFHVFLDTLSPTRQY